MQKLLEVLRLTAMLALTLNAAFVLTGCERNGNMEDAAEDVGEAVEDTGDEIEDAFD